jgi:stress-induced-phosphoprotein 1
MLFPCSALQDPRMIDVLGALMGIDIQASTRPEGSNEMPEGFQAQAPSAATPSSPSPQASSSKPTPPQAPPKEEEDVEMEDDEEAQAKKTAEAAKAAGAAAYKKRDFDNAIKQFQAAWDAWPKDLTYLTNLGAAYFEQGEFDKAIEICEKAVDEGRSVSARNNVCINGVQADDHDLPAPCRLQAHCKGLWAYRFIVPEEGRTRAGYQVL